MLDFTPDFVEILGGARSATSQSKPRVDDEAMHQKSNMQTT